MNYCGSSEWVPAVLWGLAFVALVSANARSASAEEPAQPRFRLNLHEKYPEELARWKEGTPTFFRSGKGELVLIWSSGPEGHAMVSADEGRTWHDWPAIRAWPKDAGRIVIRRGEELLLLGNQRTYCSTDEGKTWRERGRIIKFPRCGAWHWLLTSKGWLVGSLDFLIGAEGPDPDLIGTVVSEDGGQTWRICELFGPPPGHPDRPEGFGEPAVVELADGRIWMIFRTCLGHLWQAFSTDGGYTFGERTPTILTSPLANANAKRIPASDAVVVVWNNAKPGTSKNFSECPSLWRPRAPLCFAVSHDNCKSWSRPVIIFPGTGIYPSLYFSDNEMFIIYMANPDPAVRAGAKYHLEFVIYDKQTVLEVGTEKRP